MRGCRPRTGIDPPWSTTSRHALARDIDTTAALERFEQELREGPPDHRRALILAILDRWQTDADLTEQSRRRARELYERFE